VKTAELKQGIFKQRTLLLARLAELDAALHKIGLNSNGRGDNTPARESVLDDHPQVIETSTDLREDTGNISASKVAFVFGVSINKLAGWIGKSRQAVTKTPAADSLQDALRYFEKIARVRVALSNNKSFRIWLRTSLETLDYATPMHLLESGEWQVLADLVDDILTGAPA
jgi:hypothetical protein